METGTVTINYNAGCGRMVICLDPFFPCKQKDLKKLLSVIDMDWRGQEQIVKDILEFLTQKKEICESNRKYYANKYGDARTSRVECQQRIKERKATNGVRYTKEQLQEERERKEWYLQQENEYNREFKKNSKCAEQLRKNIEQLQEYNKGR